MKRNAGATCATCPFWDRGVPGQTEAEILTSEDGECRCEPPVLVLAQDEYFVWPTTRQHDWCGKHPDFEEGALQTFREKEDASKAVRDRIDKAVP